MPPLWPPGIQDGQEPHPLQTKAGSPWERAKFAPSPLFFSGDAPPVPAFGSQPSAGMAKNHCICLTSRSEREHRFDLVAAIL